jgi:hypothetical protein
VHEKPLHDQKLGVWVAKSRQCIVGPLFFEETVNSKHYCSILYNFIGPLPEHEITYSWFQHDGATSYTQLTTLMKLLKECVISRNLWPPRAPDLNPPDFYTYLWGTAKSAVDHDHPCTLNELKTAITEFIRNISQADLEISTGTSYI